MSLTVGTNSYVTLAEAEAYFLTRYGSASWSGLSGDPEKESVLIGATQLLDLYCDWSGYTTEVDQTLAFPRNAETTVDDLIKNAQCELAVAIVDNGGVVEVKQTNLTELKAETVTLKWNSTNSTNNSLYNSLVSSMLSGYCKYGAGAKLLVRV